MTSWVRIAKGKVACLHDDYGDNQDYNDNDDLVLAVELGGGDCDYYDDDDDDEEDEDDGDHILAVELG